VTLGWALAVLILLASGGLLADRLMDPAAFPIRELSYEGEFNRLDPETLRSRVEAAVDGNFFGIDLKSVERAAESVDWVQRARVRRIWPDGLHVVVQEHHLVARWGSDAWLNDQGEVVEIPAPGQKEVLRLSGPDGTAKQVLTRARGWEPDLREAGLTLKALTLNERRAWYAVVARPDGGSVFSIALGRDRTSERFKRVVEAFQSLPQEKLLRIDHVDARYPNGIALRLHQAMNSDESA
jgi:cell division protein FtsQ